MRVGTIIITFYVLYNIIYKDTVHNYSTITHRVIPKSGIRKKEFIGILGDDYKPHLPHGGRRRIG